MSTPFPNHDLPKSKPPEIITSSPTRSRPQVGRSISEVGTAKRQARNHHGHHHHPHLHRRDKDRLPEGEVPQSTLQPGVSRSEPNESRDVSRRTSVLEVPVPYEGERRREVGDKEVEEEKEKGVVRATQLRNALISLNTLSNNTTRRLDTTYYSVLEKLSVLQNTISSLKELAGMTKALNTEFKTESEEVVSDIRNQIVAFEGFESQESKIAGLQARIGQGREKITVLGGRVDVVRERVEGWERAEVEWQEKTRKRLRVLWIVVSVVAVLVVALVVLRYTPARTQGPGVLKEMNMTGLEQKVEEIRGGVFNVTHGVAMGDTLKGDGLRDGDEEEEEEEEEGVGDDPRLRLLDEL
ncbi:hypothetical protein LOCC1_G001095 [Lachnellula occidentalis]|uniref:Uncharacterized protein n=1 Tax=Lachnellula occidentalis TaxID=215460 RepID=A0A8H8S8G9_9HELO|nr:hypothetical protein LOCC1_G001095 [Lachnellula occidentalis]